MKLYCVVRRDTYVYEVEITAPGDADCSELEALADEELELSPQTAQRSSKYSIELIKEI